LTEKHNQSNLSKIRRKDRAVLDDDWIRSFLENSPSGVLCTVDKDQPFVQTNFFVYDSDNHALYLHNAEIGRTPSNIQSNNKICFTTSIMGRLLPGKQACNFSAEYASVVIFGHAEILCDLSERIHGLTLLIQKYFPNHKSGKDYPEITSEEINGTAVIKIIINEWSAKSNQASENFEGAFTFDQRK
jgi:uncharacterized protein